MGAEHEGEQEKSWRGFGKGRGWRDSQDGDGLGRGKVPGERPPLLSLLGSSTVALKGR